MNKLTIFFGISVLALLFFTSAESTAAQTRQRVRFARGSAAASVSGSVKGYKYVDYVVGAREDQTITVNLTGSSSAYFAILKPDGDNLGTEATQVKQWSGKLPASGDYAIRVLMPRAQARRGEIIKYRLRISIQ